MLSDPLSTRHLTAILEPRPAVAVRPLLGAADLHRRPVRQLAVRHNVPQLCPQPSRGALIVAVRQRRHLRDDHPVMVGNRPGSDHVLATTHHSVGRRDECVRGSERLPSMTSGATQFLGIDWSKVNWGDFPTWLTGVLTGAAVLVTGIGLLLEMRRSRRQHEHGQAELVAGWEDHLSLDPQDYLDALQSWREEKPGDTSARGCRRVHPLAGRLPITGLRASLGQRHPHRRPGRRDVRADPGTRERMAQRDASVSGARDLAMRGRALLPSAIAAYNNHFFTGVVA